MSDRERERSDQLDAAIERRRSGDPVEGGGDSELPALLALAQRLDEELPDDLPDPVFRAQLGSELAGSVTPLLLAERRWYRDWRIAALTAAAAIIIVVLVVAELATRSGPVTPARATVETAFGPPPKNNPTAAAESTNVVANTQALPPVDSAHVVQVPLGESSGSAPPENVATPVEPSYSLSGDLPEITGTARSWLLTSPPTPTTFVQNELARIGVTGTVREETQGDEQVTVGLDEGGHVLVTWRPNEAFFSYQRSPDAPTPPPARAQADPKQTARAWLEEIGFDLSTIQYDASLRADSSAYQRVVEFRPTNVPEGALDPGLGVVVWVGADGSIEQANGFWLSLVESAEVPLQTVQDAWQQAQSGQWVMAGFGPPPAFKSITIKSAEQTYLLTRADATNYLMQPVVAFSGQGQTAIGPSEVTLFVSAAAK